MSLSADSALLAKAGPVGLGLATDARFQAPEHLQLVNREIMEAVARGRQRRAAIDAGIPIDDRPEILLVEMPPRHGKSTVISEHTPPWYLGMFPDDRVILVSYEADFAATWGRKSRDIVRQHGPALYGVDVDEGSSAAKRWQVAGRKGGMVTAGVGGPITGQGAHLMIIDDPIKNAEEAMSDTIREKQWDWWLSTARTRLEPGAVVIVLMTRWHEGDLGGRLLKAAADDGDPVREIRLPALAEPNDPLGRQPGEALWPRRYTAHYLERTRKVVLAYWFSAMYQGSPTPDEGGIFPRRYFRYCELSGDRKTVTLWAGDERVAEWPTAECARVSYADLAESEKKTADYTVLTEAWVTPHRDLLIMGVYRDRIPGPDQPQFFADHYVGVLKVEQIGYQSTLIKALIRRGLPVEPVYPDKDKVTRAGAAGALYRQGKIYHRRGTEWLGDFEAEMLAFPAGEHDDQVDTVAYAARDLPNVPLITRRRRTGRRGRTIAGDLRNDQS